MTMPIIPALANPSAVTSALTDFLDSLSEDDVTTLMSAASNWAAGGEDAGQESGMLEQDQETLEDEAAESDETQAAEAEAGEEDFDSLYSQVEEIASKLQSAGDRFDDLIDQAEAVADEGGDPDAIEDLKSDAERYIKDGDKLVKLAEKAHKSEDSDGIAQAGLKLKKLCEVVDALIAEAEIHAGTSSPSAADVEAASKPAPVQTPALALWAKRYGAQA